MPGVIALVLAASLTSLPPLPQRGLVLETRAGVQLQTLAGRPLATLPGFDLALDQAAAHVAMLRSPRGSLYAFDGRALRPRTPREVGHWVWTERSPAGDAVLAQWVGECELPVAYLIVAGERRAIADETVALGWLPQGRALVHFRPLGCSSSGRRGIYAVPVNGAPRLVARTPRFAQYLMWGG